MNATFQLATVSLLLALVGACGSSSPQYDSLSALQNKAGCGAANPDTDTEMFADAQVDCGNGVTLIWFASQKAQENWSEIAKGMGTALLIGDTWAAEGSSSQLRELEKKVGGNLTAGS